MQKQRVKSFRKLYILPQHGSIQKHRIPEYTFEYIPILIQKSNGTNLHRVQLQIRRPPKLQLDHTLPPLLDLLNEHDRQQPQMPHQPTILLQLAIPLNVLCLLGLQLLPHPLQTVIPRFDDAVDCVVVGVVVLDQLDLVCEELDLVVLGEAAH